MGENKKTKRKKNHMKAGKRGWLYTVLQFTGLIQEEMNSISGNRLFTNITFLTKLTVLK